MEIHEIEWRDFSKVGVFLAFSYHQDYDTRGEFLSNNHTTYKFFCTSKYSETPIFRIHLLKMFPYSSFQLIFFPQSRREITSKSLLHLWSLKNARYWETSYLNNFLLAWTLICLKANNKQQASFEKTSAHTADFGRLWKCSYHWGNVFCEKVLFIPLRQRFLRESIRKEAQSHCDIFRQCGG